MFFGFNFHKQVSSLKFLYSFWVGSTGFYFFDQKRWRTNFISCNDSKMINLGKSLSVSESESDRYLMDFLKEEAMTGVDFSLVLCSTTHHGVQLVLEISQGENPFALVETRIHYQYTHIKIEIPSLCQFLVPYNLTVVKILLSTQLPLSPRLLAPIR